MDDVQLILVGYALAAVPIVDAGRIAVAAIGKWMGVSPKAIKSYNAATDDPTDDSDS